MVDHTYGHFGRGQHEAAEGTPAGAVASDDVAFLPVYGGDEGAEVWAELDYVECWDG